MDTIVLVVLVLLACILGIWLCVYVCACCAGCFLAASEQPPRGPNGPPKSYLSDDTLMKLASQRAV